VRRSSRARYDRFFVSTNQGKQGAHHFIMTTLVEQLRAPKIESRRGELSRKELDAHTAVVVLLSPERSSLRALPYGREIEARMRRAGCKLESGSPFVTDLPNRHGTRIALAALKSGASAFDRLSIARKLVGAQMERRSESLVLATTGLEANARDGALEALLAAALAADFEMPRFRSAPDKSRRLKQLVVCGSLAELVRARTVATALGNNLARYLTALPPNELTPDRYRHAVQTLARARGWRSTFFDLKKLQRLGAGAFIAVAQGSPNPDAGILHLRYTPRRPSKRAPLALVGKGICFDTGGTNLKSAKHMHGMHEDMEGSAVALGTLLALTELKVDFPVECWLALAQNHIGPKAYRQNEVIKSASGTTIEIVHTDAEGRMVLADTLTLAARTKPRVIIDYATLTGSCIGALGTRMSGAMTNRREWLSPLIDAGEASGERVWPFPLPNDYDELLKSDIADVKQCTVDSDADQILAALFLQRFVPKKTGWVHIDLASGNNKGGLAHIPTDVTGFGVRFTLNLLLDRKLDT
jgi:leucyl aminopeptidase